MAINSPRFKESAHDRAHRLDLGKPHIYWCREKGGWYVAFETINWEDEITADYINDQDRRWTPRDKS